MSDKKFTDEEIIKGLQRMSEEDPDGFSTDVLKAIEHKNSEIDKLDIELKTMRGAANSYKAEVERLKADNKIYVEANKVIGYQRDQRDKEIDELQKQIDGLDIHKNKIKAEAYKKFAREVTEEIKKAYDNNSSVLREHFEKHREKPNFEFVATIQGKMNTLRGLDDFIDNLKKEMVGEEE